MTDGSGVTDGTGVTADGTGVGDGTGVATISSVAFVVAFVVLGLSSSSFTFFSVGIGVGSPVSSVRSLIVGSLVDSIVVSTYPLTPSVVVTSQNTSSFSSTVTTSPFIRKAVGLVSRDSDEYSPTESSVTYMTILSPS